MMKECLYCGRENADDAVYCCECGKDEFKTNAPADAAASDLNEEMVTLVSVQKLVDADLILSRLEASGIEGFIPDEFLLQTIGFNLNTYGYVRVQVRRKDFEKAKELLSTPNENSPSIIR